MKWFPLLVGLIPIVLSAQSIVSPPDGTPNPPVPNTIAAPKQEISSAQRAGFWRAAAEFNQIKPIYERAQETLQATVAKLEKWCAETGQTFGSNAAGEPACIDKPKK